MKSKHRDVFIFVNIINFQKPGRKREAGTTDRDKLIILFREMGLECFYYEDISKDHFMELLKKLSVWPALQKYDCLVFCVSSHGNGDRNENNIIEFSDGNMLYVNDIIPYFSNSSCSHLLGKPKIFIFPSCRWPNLDRALTTLPMQLDSSDAEHNEANTIVDLLQTYSDIKICYSTVSGYSSHRDAITGSWYIEAMSQKFYKFSHNMHLENLLKLISEEMKDYVGENNEMQTPCNEEIGFM
ncbi:caspase Dronc-like isoform X2 [Contarinia nasturtii]|uniref:caspase Dronc-like isoform X2 n=1 Tax=Contarinia nasturtii TaxID=265458 RepID=UPI0012D3F46D|nr:caspase Dronc-like isoform X2 [Contarinia nasturtii]